MKILFALFGVLILISTGLSQSVVTYRNPVILPYMRFISYETMLANPAKAPTNLIKKVKLLSPQDQYSLCSAILEWYHDLVFCLPLTNEGLYLYIENEAISKFAVENNIHSLPSISTVRLNQATISRFALSIVKTCSESVRFLIRQSVGSFFNCEGSPMHQEPSQPPCTTDWFSGSRIEDSGYRPAATLCSLLLSIGPVSPRIKEYFFNFDSIKWPPEIPPSKDTSPFFEQFESIRSTRLLDGQFGYIYNIPVSFLAGKWKSGVSIICIDFNARRAASARTKGPIYFLAEPAGWPNALTVLQPEQWLDDFSIAFIEDSCAISFPPYKLDSITLHAFIEIHHDYKMIDNNRILSRMDNVAYDVRGAYFNISDLKCHPPQTIRYVAIEVTARGSSHREIYILKIGPEGIVAVPVTDTDRL